MRKRFTFRVGVLFWPLYTRVDGFTNWSFIVWCRCGCGWPWVLQPASCCCRCWAAASAAPAAASAASAGWTSAPIWAWQCNILHFLLRNFDWPTSGKLRFKQFRIKDIDARFMNILYTACPFIFAWPWHGVKPIRLLEIFLDSFVRLQKNQTLSSRRL